ncbi:MAG TPA: ATP-grasp domain-containing protein [Candidatus Saccharimonadia bacterium]|nr:ATP-grasp domain-containing protein [Candidatus Saccharimonadia bacterium]
MQHGPYIQDRALPNIIRDACRMQGINLQAFSNDWVLRLEKNGQIRWIVGYKFDINLSASGQLAQDKVATYTALNAANIPAIEHYLVRSVPHDPTQWHLDLPKLDGQAVVLKPLDGTGGRAVERFESLAGALQVAQHSGEPAWAISPHYNLQAEYRLVMLDGKLLLSLEKTQPVAHGKLKMFNLGHGAVAADIVDESLVLRLQTMATQVMQTLSLRFAAVDIVCVNTNDLRVLEVNDGITLEHYARQSAEYKKRATKVYETAVAALFAE